MSEDQLARPLICLTRVLDVIELVQIMGSGDTISQWKLHAGSEHVSLRLSKCPHDNIGQ